MQDQISIDLARSRIIGIGEMADLVRQYDWSSTSIGPVESWSRELVTIINLTLASSSPARTMWGTDLILIYNDAYRPFPGPRHPYALGKSAREVYRESWHIVGPMLEEALATGQTVFHEKLLVPLPTESGLRDAYLNYAFNPIFEDGRICGLFGSLHDVTGEVVAVRKLAESEARASRILQSIGDAVIVTDEQALITDMNHVAETLTGWTLDDARGQLLSTVFHIVDEEQRELAESPADKVRRLGTVIGLANHTILIGRSGIETAIDDSGAPIRDKDGKLTGIVLVFRDITERKMAERTLAEGRARAFEALQQAPVFFALLQGPDHVFTMANPPYMRLVNNREVLNKPVRTALPEAVGQGYIEILDKVFQGEPFVGSGLRFQVDNSDGLPPDEHVIDFLYQPLRETDGSVSGIIVLGNDVTVRKTAEEAMQRLAAIVDSSDDVILSKDLNGIITSWNAAASRLFGYTPKEMIGESILKLIPESLRSEETEFLESVRAGKHVEHFDTVRLTKDGNLIEVSLTISPIRDADGRVIGASKILRDVSDRKRIERSLIQAEKIAATGRMAATIAHEINNPLDAVVNLLYLLRPIIHDQDGITYLAMAEAELERVSHIAKQTLGYYRENAAASKASLSEIAKHAVAVYSPRCTAAGITISTSFRSSRLLTLRRGEMTQVISNLIANSIHAMPDGGHLSLIVEDADQPVSGITLKISDDGVGIASGNLLKVFEAFFTTRTTVGTGIGLFVAKQFIEGHGGFISVTSQVNAENHGTTFCIYLPLHTPYEISADAHD
ncbi:PAS domain-containing sensor histidine kinase [Granulicella sp. L56]|uniref:PAS domain-containing sensor histidine kinase n=1 Tax=Granulicella sp. L56 TaxID=1747222 RepID=UPI00131A7DAE|nr:PAS domain-containing sensor histidine kinase [Granulicella sp. L56]MDW5265140.1 PAS domain S-box protein [Edaphobacter sp.]